MGLIEVDSKPPTVAGTAPEPAVDPSAFHLIPGLGPKDLDRELRLADRQTDVGTRRLAFYLADMEQRGVCQMLGYPTATVYAVKRLELGRRHAQQLIAAGRALEDLPGIDAAFCDGRLNWSRVRLLVKIAVPETENEWLAQALSLGWTEFERLVLRSERGRPPRKDGKGLPAVRIGIRARVDRLVYEKWELAKRKLGDERGESATDADLMELAANLMLGTRDDGTVPGRQRLNDSIYRIVVDRCSDCRSTYLQTAEGAAELPRAALDAIACDAKLVNVGDGQDAAKDAAAAVRARAPRGPGDLAPPTPPWMRARVLARDGYACRICGSKVDVQVHHVTWRSLDGRTTPSNEACICSRCHGLVHENLVLMSGVAPHGLRITDRDGNALERSGAAIGAAVRRERPASSMAGGPSAGSGSVPEMTFDALPEHADPAWFARHANLFRWSVATGEMAFEAGLPVEPSSGERGNRRPIADAAGQPAALARLTGQARVVAAFRTAITAARVRGRPLPHALLLGEAGLGKSTIAKAVANEMGCAVSMTSGPLIKDSAVMIRLLTALEPGEVVFIDEIHGLPRSVAETLYEAMEDGVLRLPVTDGHRSKTIEVGLHPFTLIGATTEIGRLPGPLQSRFTIREFLDVYADGEIAAIVRSSAARDGLAIEDAAAGRIARMARGVPRDAIKLALRLQDRALAKGVGRIDGAFVETGLAEFGIDEQGLGSIERRALGALVGHGRGRPMGLTRWAAASGIGVSVLRQVCEPVLIRRGLMTVTPRGRMALDPTGCVAVA